MFKAKLSVISDKDDFGGSIKDSEEDSEKKNNTDSKGSQREVNKEKESQIRLTDPEFEFEN